MVAFGPSGLRPTRPSAHVAFGPNGLRPMWPSAHAASGPCVSSRLWLVWPSAHDYRLAFGSWGHQPARPSAYAVSGPYPSPVARPAGAAAPAAVSRVGLKLRKFIFEEIVTLATVQQSAPCGSRRLAALAAHDARAGHTHARIAVRLGTTQQRSAHGRRTRRGLDAPCFTARQWAACLHRWCCAGRC